LDAIAAAPAYVRNARRDVAFEELYGPHRRSF